MPSLSRIVELESARLHAIQWAREAERHSKVLERTRSGTEEYADTEVDLDRCITMSMMWATVANSLRSAQ